MQTASDFLSVVFCATASGWTPEAVILCVQQIYSFYQNCVPMILRLGFGQEPSFVTEDDEDEDAE